MKLVYFSVTSNEIPNLSEACRLFTEKTASASVEIYARTRTQLQDNEEMQESFVKHALKADIIFITLMAGSQSCPAWDDLISAMEEQHKNGNKIPWFHIQPTGSNPDSLEIVQQLSDGTDDDTWTNLSRYYRYGGVENLMNMLGFCTTVFIIITLI